MSVLPGVVVAGEVGAGVVVGAACKKQNMAWSETRSAGIQIAGFLFVQIGHLTAVLPSIHCLAAVANTNHLSCRLAPERNRKCLVFQISISTENTAPILCWARATRLNFLDQIDDCPPLGDDPTIISDQGRSVWVMRSRAISNSPKTRVAS